MKVNPYKESSYKLQGENIFQNSENHETFQTSAQSKNKLLNINKNTNHSFYQHCTENQNNQYFLNDDMQIINVHN